MPRKTVLIYEGSDFEKLADLRRNVAIAERAKDLAERNSKTEPRRAGDEISTELQRAVEAVEAAQVAYNEFVDIAAERAEEWILESIGFQEFRDLQLEHHPRMQAGEGEDAAEVEHPDDAEWGFNIETFGKALLLFVDEEDPEHRTVKKAGDHDLAKLVTRVKRLSEGQYETLWATAYGLNKGGIADPKLQRFLLAGQRSSET